MDSPAAPRADKPAVRTVFIVSDGTGITAETFSHSILAQFEMRFRKVRMPFIDTPEKAHMAVGKINEAFHAEGVPPIVFTTLVNAESNKALRRAKGMILDMFQTFIEPLEKELGLKSTHAIGRFHQNADTEAYKNRIEAINFSLAHDDGQSHKNLAEADVILVGVSRSGKTPTSLYLAMQYGLKAANYPLIPDDFERESYVGRRRSSRLPGAIVTTASPEDGSGSGHDREYHHRGDARLQTEQAARDEGIGIRRLADCQERVFGRDARHRDAEEAVLRPVPGGVERDDSPQAPFAERPEP